ncbi:hypothetical protein V8J85_19495 [Yoonia sp. 2307UL14-13]
MRNFLIAVNLALLWPVAANAHASAQGFVLLLPTGAYTAAGVAAVALTVVALFAVPERVVNGMFGMRTMTPRKFGLAPTVTSLLSLGTMIFVVYLGLFGPRSPLSNLMPLSFWTLGWVALISLSAIFGNLWHWINPWTGLAAVLGLTKPVFRLPDWLGLWPATGMLIAFAAFLLADPAPDDPIRLAQIVLGYWTIIFLGMSVFGRPWLRSVELGHALFAALASLSAVRSHMPAGIGGPGWQIVKMAPLPAAGLFALTFLGVGSFDGLNETFWWLGTIGVNPLEFPGRSAVIGVTVMGLLGSIIGLIAVFALVVWLGVVLIRAKVPFSKAFSTLGLSVLPIALVYHIAHYLPSFLVSIQYTVAALSDPFARGDDWLGLEPFRVTTGFFNRIDTVRLIWITQAGLVVLGHVWSVLLAHRLATDLFGGHRRAAIATLPLSVFMIAYTFLGLWLLAAPRGA